MFLLILTCFVVVLFMLWISIINSKRKFNIGGPFPLPVLGNAHLFVVKTSEFLNLLYKLSKKYGDAYVVYFLSVPYVILSHPQYIEPIVSSSELITKGRSYDFLHPWLGYGLLTSTGQRWKAHRKFLTPAFHFNILQNFLPVFCKNGRILSEKLDKLAQEGPISLFPVVALAALDNVTEAIMGLSVNSQKDSHSQYVKSIEILSEIIALRMQVPLLGEDFIFNWTSYKNKQEAAINFLHMHTKDVINARKEDLKRLNITCLKESNELGIKNKHAFLDLLLLAEVDGNKIDEESVREEVDTFMFEGHDTTASGIVFTLFCMSKYPDVQEKVLNEQKTIFGDDLDRDPTYAEVQQMKYLEMVIKESLRIYPSVPLVERKVTRDIEVGGLKLQKGASVTLNIFQMQRHEGVYEQPLEFRPERFEAGAPDTKNPFAYLVFSAGPRNCIGQRFAMMELKVTVAQIVKQFRLLPVKQEPELCADLILRSKNGVHVQFARR